MILRIVLKARSSVASRAARRRDAAGRCRGRHSIVRSIIACMAVLMSVTAAAHAAKVKARVTDVSGRTYDMASLRLSRGNKLQVICGGARMIVPFKQVSVMKIDPGQIQSVDGQPFFGVEIRTRQGAVIGNVMETGQCFVGVGSLRGKTSQKASYSVPFNSLTSVQFLGKGEDAGAGRGDDDEEDEEEE